MSVGLGTSHREEPVLGLWVAARNRVAAGRLVLVSVGVHSARVSAPAASMPAVLTAARQNSSGGQYWCCVM